MEGARLLTLLVLLATACFVIANDETLSELEKSEGNDESGDLASGTSERNDQYDDDDSPPITELQEAAKNQRINEIKIRLTAFSGPLVSRAKESLSSLNRSWTSLSNDAKERALETLGVISSNIEAYGNASGDPVSAMEAATNILASVSSSFEPKGELSSTAQGFVPALLGLFGKGPKPKSFDAVIGEQIKDTLAKYPENILSSQKSVLLSAFKRAKAYLDNAAKSGKPFSTKTVPLAKKEVQRLQGAKFMGILVNKTNIMFDDNKWANARKAIKYCEMYAQLAVYRDIILTQYISMIPTDAKWQTILNETINKQESLTKTAEDLLGKLYAVDYDSAIIPFFDPDVSVITDAYSTEMLKLGDYDRSMTGLYCLMTERNGRLEELVWSETDKHFKPANNPYTILMKEKGNDNCFWKIVPHAGNTSSIVNKFKCKEKNQFCDWPLSWSMADGKAYVDIDANDPILWEIGGSNDWKYIRNKFGCGKMNSKKWGKWCSYDIRMKDRTVSQSSTKLVGQLLPGEDKGYWKLRKACG